MTSSLKARASLRRNPVKAPKNHAFTQSPGTDIKPLDTQQVHGCLGNNRPREHLRRTFNRDAGQLRTLSSSHLTKLGHQGSDALSLQHADRIRSLSATRRPSDAGQRAQRLARSDEPVGLARLVDVAQHSGDVVTDLFAHRLDLSR